VSSDITYVNKYVMLRSPCFLFSDKSLMVYTNAFYVPVVQLRVPVIGGVPTNILVRLSWCRFDTLYNF